MPPPRLSLSGVSSGYGGYPVLDGVGLEVGAGECVAIIGPNGHGKTTLLRTISGLVPLQSGEIRLDGAVISGLSVHRIVEAGVVHVPQGDLLFPDMTVVENLQMGAYLPAAARRYQRRLGEVFELLPALRERRNQRASTLSGGERRMAGIARGLMMEGRLLMLDEPSLGLAPVVIDQVYGLIGHLTGEGRTVVVVEENPLRIAQRAHRLHLLDEGRFVWTGSGQALLDRPRILEAYLGG